MNALVLKFKEVLYSVLPITILVLILNFTLTPLESPLIIRFLIGAVLIIFGLTIFLLGVDTGITPIGTAMGSTIVKSNKVWIVTTAGLLLGFFISIAEPDLHILAGQIDYVTSGLIAKSSIIVVVSIGIGVMISLGLNRIIYDFPLSKIFFILYGVIFILTPFTSREFLAIAFDSAGAATGALTVPFILALALGVSIIMKNGKSSEENSFGLVGIAFAGPIISIILMSIIINAEIITSGLGLNEAMYTTILGPFIEKLPATALEVSIALVPILFVFLVFQKVSFKLSRSTVLKIVFGMLFAFLGLTMFLLGVNAGFMEVGSIVGYKLASMENKIYIVIIGFILGMVTVLAEPAVHVLTHQIEDVTSGYVKRRVVLIALSLGIATAVALSIIRILIPEIQLWHYLIPGYIISIVMAHFVPELFVGIAFDSGAVASGPMSATFIMAFAQGAAEAIEHANVLIDGFGMIAMVAMAPVIALEVLGFIFKAKSKKEE